MSLPNLPSQCPLWKPPLKMAPLFYCSPSPSRLSTSKLVGSSEVVGISGGSGFRQTREPRSTLLPRDGLHTPPSNPTPCIGATMSNKTIVTTVTATTTNPTVPKSAAGANSTSSNGCGICRYYISGNGGTGGCQIHQGTWKTTESCSQFTKGSH